MPDRPRRQDFDGSKLDMGDLMYEIALIRYELNGAHRESHAWLASFRSKMEDAARLLLIVIPVVLAAALAGHLAN